jgi:RimJ/RimL family protein N-acetyltransferase
MKDPDIRYFTLDQDGRAVGFVLLAGLESEHGSVEFRRIDVAEKGRGFGRAAVEAVKTFCFEELGAHRLWLDVVESNTRARSLYESSGFRFEGVLRDALKSEDGFHSLVVMSILSSEHERAR